MDDGLGDKVVKLIPKSKIIKKEIDAKMVEVLEKLLEDVIEGRISNIVFMTHYESGQMSHASLGEFFAEDMLLFMGLAEMVKTEFAGRMTSISEQS